MAASVLIAGMSVGVAAAANYPAPFVDAGTANVAIVYGTGSGVSSLDSTQANSIQSNLASKIGGSTTSAVTGEGFKFEKTSTKYHLGDNITEVISSAVDGDESELPTLLADGKYIDDDNDEIDYTQKIVIGPLNQLSMFEDNDYISDQPTVGFRIPASQLVMTYTLTFEDSLLYTDMPTTDLPIMGKNYYVLSNTTGTSEVLTLLDSAEETTLGEGESKTIGGKTVSIDFIGSSTVKLDIDGEITNTLSALDTFKLSDGTYVGIKTINTQDYQGGIKRVEFSLGSGKLKITSGSDVQINDEAVSGLVGTLSDDDQNTISSIALAWSADDDLFVTESSVITMPGFEAVSLSYGGLTYPVEETIEVKQGGTTYAVLENFPLKDGEADINFIYGDSTSFTQLGKDSDNRLVTVRSGNLTYDKDTDDYFVVSWSDSNDAESYLMRFTNFVLDSSTNKTDLQYYKNGAWTTKKSGVKDADTISIGNAEVKIFNVTRVDKKVNISANSANTNFHTLYSEEGMTVYLPWLNTTWTDINGTTYADDATACATLTLQRGEMFTGILQYNKSHVPTNTTACATTFNLATREEDENANKYNGDWINLTIGWDGSSPAEVEVTAITMSNTDATSTEIGETDVWRDFTYSALATEVLWNKPSSGQKSVKLMYHGDEVAADVYITDASAVVTTTSSALGDVLVMDSEVSSVSSKNLIIVGGSCINSAAATVLGGAYCGADFTGATGVGSGQFLIQGFDGAYSSGKIAMVVAGYDASDTVNAATYLLNNVIDTSKKYIGTSAISANMVVESA